jgi:hypothetical protein
MSTRQFELLLPMGGLFGVSIYKAAVETPDGYRDEPVDPYSLDWRWYVHIRTYECVRMAGLRGPMRVLGSPLGEGASAYDVPHTMVLVHDLMHIWAMTPFDFQTEYDSAKLLVEAMPHGNVGVCAALLPTTSTS